MSGTFGVIAPQEIEVDADTLNTLFVAMTGEPIISEAPTLRSTPWKVRVTRKTNTTVSVTLR